MFKSVSLIYEVSITILWNFNFTHVAQFQACYFEFCGIQSVKEYTQLCLRQPPNAFSDSFKANSRSGKHTARASGVREKYAKRSLAKWFSKGARARLNDKGASSVRSRKALRGSARTLFDGRIFSFSLCGERLCPLPAYTALVFSLSRSLLGSHVQPILTGRDVVTPCTWRRSSPSPCVGARAANKRFVGSPGRKLLSLRRDRGDGGTEMRGDIERMREII